MRPAGENCLPPLEVSVALRALINGANDNRPRIEHASCTSVEAHTEENQSVVLLCRLWLEAAALSESWEAATTNVGWTFTPDGTLCQEFIFTGSQD